MKWIMITVLLLLTLTLEGFAQGFSRPELTLSVQDSRDTARVTARWYYNAPPSWTVSYEHWLVDGSTELWRDTTGTQLVNFDVARTDSDQTRSFCVRILRLAPSPKPGDPTCQTFVVGARVPYVVLADTTTSTPVVIPHSPAMEHSQGTIWMDLIPTSIGSRQGLFCKDHNGFGTGGHLCLTMLPDGSVEARIQDTTQSYEVVGGQLVQGDPNQIALEYGTGGFILWVNGAAVGSNPYEGGTQGNVEALRVGASSQNAPSGSTEFTLPFTGSIDLQWYDGDYDFSGDWNDETPLPPPPPVDSLVIEVASIHQIGVHNTPNDAVWMHITPIYEARELVMYKDGVETERKVAILAPVNDPGVTLSYNSVPGAWEVLMPNGSICVNDSWGWNGTDCFNRQQIYNAVERRSCDDPFMTCPLPESATLA